MVNPSLVTCRPSPPVPASWAPKSRMVLSMPRPRMVTSSTSSDSVPVNWKVPSRELDRRLPAGGQERGLRPFLQVVPGLDHGDLGPGLDGGLLGGLLAGCEREQKASSDGHYAHRSSPSRCIPVRAILRCCTPRPAILRRPLLPRGVGSFRYASVA